MKLWKADLTIPFIYIGDGLLNGMLIKGIVDNGWYLHNSFIGMPFGLDFYDFPMSDIFHLLIMKIIALFTHNYALIINLYFLFSFPLTALSSLYVFKKFGLSDGPSLVGSLLFTFMPYHFMRGEGHLFLSTYYIIPLIIMVILWIHLEKDPIFFSNNNINNSRKILFNNKAVFSIFICLLIASTGFYYAFFACYFIVIIGILSYLYHKDIYRMLAALILIIIIIIGVIGNIFPNLLYQYNNGSNIQVTQRNFSEAEIYGLKISQLLLPVDGHRIPIVSILKLKYNTHAPLVNENITSSLGLIGSIGFILLLFWLFFKKSPKEFHIELINGLSVLNLSAILLSTIGGFGVLFNLIVFSKIRAYNRISIFISFISIFAIILLLDLVIKKIRIKYWKSYSTIILIIVLVVGILDQTNNSMIPINSDLTSEYTNDKHFINKIESSVPKNAMIFQLPYIPFPENPSVNSMVDYDLFRGYLHSRTLRWSYGTMKGRYGDLWQKNIAALPMDKMLEQLSLSGFIGIYIDRYGFDDIGASLEKQLSVLLGTAPIISDNERLSFFSMANYNERLRAKYTDTKWISEQDNALYPLYLEWRKSFSRLEGTPENNWRWCSSKGKLYINNSSKDAKVVNITMSFATGYSNNSNLLINSDLFEDKLKINSNELLYSKDITISPGKHVIEFECDALRINAPDDSRNLVFRVNNFVLKANDSGLNILSN